MFKTVTEYTIDTSSEFSYNKNRIEENKPIKEIPNEFATKQEEYEWILALLMQRFMDMLETFDLNKAVEYLNNFSEKLLQIYEVQDYEFIKNKTHEIFNFYDVKNKNETTQFIQTYPFLIFPLMEFLEYARRHFPESELILEIEYDHSILKEQLSIKIKTTKKAEEAMELLDRIDEEWWLNTYSKYGELLCLNLQYR